MAAISSNLPSTYFDPTDANPERVLISETALFEAAHAHKATVTLSEGRIAKLSELTPEAHRLHMVACKRGIATLINGDLVEIDGKHVTAIEAHKDTLHSFINSFQSIGATLTTFRALVISMQELHNREKPGLHIVYNSTTPDSVALDSEGKPLFTDFSYASVESDASLFSRDIFDLGTILFAMLIQSSAYAARCRTFLEQEDLHNFMDHVLLFPPVEEKEFSDIDGGIIPPSSFPDRGFRENLRIFRGLSSATRVRFFVNIRTLIRALTQFNPEKVISLETILHALDVIEEDSTYLSYRALLSADETASIPDDASVNSADTDRTLTLEEWNQLSRDEQEALVFGHQDRDQNAAGDLVSGTTTPRLTRTPNPAAPDEEGENPPSIHEESSEE